MKKRFFSILLILAALLLVSGCAVLGKARLSELTPEEQISFLKTSGVEFPNGFPPEEHVDFIVQTVKQAEDGTYATPVLSNPLALKAAEDIAAAVKLYYGN